jgi:hypothetical protein
MCPACFTTLALIAGGTGSAGGLTAFVARKLHLRRKAKRTERAAATPDSKEVRR